MCLDNWALTGKGPGGRVEVGLAAKGEWYSTAVLYRFSTAIIKSVRDSTSYFLPTFSTNLDSTLPLRLLARNSTTTGSHFHSIRHTISLWFFGPFFFLSWYFSQFRVRLDERSRVGDAFFSPRSINNRLGRDGKQYECDCTPSTLCHARSHWTVHISLSLSCLPLSFY